MKSTRPFVYVWKTFFCKGCNPKALDLLKLVHSIKEKNNELHAMMQTVEVKVEAIDKSLEERVEKAVKRIVRKEVHESRQREERRLNVVIKNLLEETPDSDALNGVVRAWGLGSFEKQQDWCGWVTKETEPHRSGFNVETQNKK